MLQRHRGHRRKPGAGQNALTLASASSTQTFHSSLSDNIRGAKIEQFPDDGFFTRKHISSRASVFTGSISSLTVCYRKSTDFTINSKNNQLCFWRSIYDPQTTDSGPSSRHETSTRRDSSATYWLHAHTHSFSHHSEDMSWT